MIKKVYGSNVVIEVREVKAETSSGIFIPTAQGQKQQIGVVVAVGTGHTNMDGTVTPLDVQVGATVIYEKYAGTQIIDNNKAYLVINEKDILVELEAEKE